MRLHFQADPWDLYVIVGYSVVMSALLLVFNVGNILVTLLVLFAPGYVLAAVLFPGSLSSKKSEIDWIERVAISLGLSIAIVPLLGLLLSFTPLAIRFKPIVATIALFTTSMGYAAYM